MAIGNGICLPVTVISYEYYFHSPNLPPPSCKHSSPCQISLGKHVSSLLEQSFKEREEAGLPQFLQQPCLCIHVRAHTRVELCARGFLAKSVLESLEGGLAICSNRLYSWPDDQMNQDRDCCCGPVRPSHAGLLQQSHRHYSPCKASLNLQFKKKRLSKKKKTRWSCCSFGQTLMIKW